MVLSAFGQQQLASYLAVTAALSLSFLANSSAHTLNLNTSQFTYWFYIICFNAD
jgi:hypothetical protein